MANQFDSTNYPTTEPESLTVGDRVAWKRTDLGSDYAPASYALTYNARLQGAGSTTFSITASESGDDYLVEVASATSAAYTPGNYNWSAYITRSSDSERVEIDSGVWSVDLNLAASTDDPRTHAAVMVDKLEATLESLAAKLTTSYSIADRSNTLRSMEECKQQLREYRAEVRRETYITRAKNGQRTGESILTRF